jgi:hypothetical protein
MARCDVRAVFLPALAGAAFWMLANWGGTALAAEAPTPARKPPPAAESSEDPFGAPARPKDPFAAPEADVPPGTRPVPAPPLPTEPPPRRPLRRHTRDEIEKVLDSTTELDFVETPLSDVVDYLKDCHEIEIQVEKRRLDSAGVGTDSPITLSVKGVPLRTGLSLVLRSLDLTWLVENEALVITTPEGAESRRTTEVYDVTDLVACRDENDRPWHDLDPLVAAARGAAAGNGRAESDAVTGATFGNAAVLVVTHSQPGHERVVALLEKIRKVVAQRGAQGEAPRRNRPEPKKPEHMGMGTSGAGGMGKLNRDKTPRKPSGGGFF